MKIESLIKRIQIMGYESDNDDYDWVVCGEIEADMILFQNLKGSGFLKSIDAIVELLTLEYGINQVFATMTMQNTKIILRLLEKKYKVKILRTVENANRKMYLIRITKN